MKEIIDPQRRANAMTLGSLCKALIKEHKGILSYCSPVTETDGKVVSVKVIVKLNGGKQEFRFNADGEDILTDLEHIQLINYKIQNLCLKIVDIEKSMTK